LPTRGAFETSNPSAGAGFSYLAAYISRTSASGCSSSRSASTYLTANGARLHDVSDENEVRRLCALPHGDDSELTSLKNVAGRSPSSLLVSMPASGVVSLTVAALPEPARSIALIAPVSAGFFFSQALPASSGAASIARIKWPGFRELGRELGTPRLSTRSRRFQPTVPRAGGTAHLDGARHEGYQPTE